MYIQKACPSYLHTNLRLDERVKVFIFDQQVGRWIRYCAWSRKPLMVDVDSGKVNDSILQLTSSNTSHDDILTFRLMTLHASCYDTHISSIAYKLKEKIFHIFVTQTLQQSLLV